jgi:predicted dehydrogenase
MPETEGAMSPSRRDFAKAAALGLAPAVRPLWGQSRPNNTINIGVVGVHSRGRDHYERWASIPGVRVAYLCDPDERLFPVNVAAVEKLAGYRPKTAVDIRRLLEDKDLDAISIAAPDHWHALATIWGCQAGKDVYVEKPMCHSLREGRKMVEAARKYNRIVQCGLDRRSQPGNYSAARFVQEGKFGKAYRGKAFVGRPRMSIGKTPNIAVPEGVNWDVFLGPAPMRPFTLNRFHYGWHFFWETATAEMGNNGVHAMDQLRWSMGLNTHPVKIRSEGLVLRDGSEQETPQVENASFEYADGTLMEIEVSTMPGPSFGSMVIYTPTGYLTSGAELTGAGGQGGGRGAGRSGVGAPPVSGQAAPGTPGRGGWITRVAEMTPRTPERATGLLVAGVAERTMDLSFPTTTYSTAPVPDLGSRVSHWQNFIDCVRSRKREDLVCDVLEGHMSTALCHLANISFRTGRTLTFDPATETFPNDKEANALLTRKYREPFVVPEKV